MGNKKLLLYLVGTEAMLLLCIALSNLNPTPILYFILYNLLYGLIFSFLAPLYCVRKEKESLASIGMKKLGTRQFAVLAVFVVCHRRTADPQDSRGGIYTVAPAAVGNHAPYHAHIF